MNCLILEDEPLAVDILREYIQDVPELEVAAVCGDALEAMKVLRTQKMDLLFVDIHLPKISGLDFIRSLPAEQAIIITTAYDAHAVQAFNLNVIDYLLKPIEFSRFVVAVNKVFDRKKYQSAAVTPIAATRPFRFFNVDKKQVKVYFDQITHIESLKDYVKVHYADKFLVTKLQIGELEEILDREHFIRVHKSYIVAKSAIQAKSATTLEIGRFTIPIGRTYKGSL